MLTVSTPLHACLACFNYKVAQPLKGLKPSKAETHKSLATTLAGLSAPLEK